MNEAREASFDRESGMARLDDALREAWAAAADLWGEDEDDPARNALWERTWREINGARMLARKAMKHAGFEP